MTKNINCLSSTTAEGREANRVHVEPPSPQESHTIVKEPIHTSLLTLAATRWETTAHFLEIKAFQKGKK